MSNTSEHYVLRVFCAYWWCCILKQNDHGLRIHVCGITKLHYLPCDSFTCQPLANPPDLIFLLSIFANYFFSHLIKKSLLMISQVKHFVFSKIPSCSSRTPKSNELYLLGFLILKLYTVNVQSFLYKLILTFIRKIDLVIILSFILAYLDGKNWKIVALKRAVINNRKVCHTF